MAESSNKRVLQGVVVSNKMDKTVAVLVERVVKDPAFHKYLRRHVRYKAHDETNQCGMGDKVLIIESRPLSKEKRWRVSEILEKAK
jgi:small subunit ribosomal protein S17